MSKSTINDDIKKRAEYDKMDFNEFLEMLGRVAHYRYKDSPMMKDRPLDEKLMPIIEQVLSSFGMSLKYTVVEIEYISQSEDEFDQN